jgi:hypothetical protein
VTACDLWNRHRNRNHFFFVGVNGAEVFLTASVELHKNENISTKKCKTWRYTAGRICTFFMHFFIHTTSMYVAMIFCSHSFQIRPYSSCIA